MKPIKISFVSFLLMLAVGLSLAGCRATAPIGPDASAGAAAAAADTTNYVRLSPLRVDIRGVISQREYNQGQMLLLVEGFPDLNSRFNQAVVLVTPITQIVGMDGKSLSLNELNIGQQVAIQFRGRFRESISGFSAQATARKMWIEPLGE